jgi:uncharacterized protein YfaS (alpha-2-macroglobulin family)
LTSYVLFVFNMATQEGVRVPPEALERGKSYLRSFLSSSRGDLRQAMDNATDAFAVDALAALGMPDPGATTRLFERRAALPLSAKALLAHAIMTQHGDRAQALTLLDALESTLRRTATGATVADPNLAEDGLLSEGVSTGLVLRALLVLDPHHPLAAPLARGLLDLRKDGQFRSTHEAAFALLALQDYRKTQEPEAPRFEARAFLGDALLARHTFRERDGQGDTTLRIPLADLVPKTAPQPLLTFQKEGQGTLFYDARLTYTPQDLPQHGLDRGFFVRKGLRGVAQKDLDTALTTRAESPAKEMTVGDLALLDLTVVNRDERTQVVLDDPLPAGLEPVETALATTSDGLASGVSEESSIFFHREHRDDRVLTFIERLPPGIHHFRYVARATSTGDFVAPPTRASCMYQPDVFGRTGAPDATAVGLGADSAPSPRRGRGCGLRCPGRGSPRLGPRGGHDLPSAIAPASWKP